MKVTFPNCGLRGVSAPAITWLASYYSVSPSDVVERAIRIIDSNDLERAATYPDIPIQSVSNVQKEILIGDATRFKLVALSIAWRMKPQNVLEAAIAQLHDIATGDKYKAHFVQDWIKS